MVVVVGAGQLRDRLTRPSGAGAGAVGAVVGVLGVMGGLGEAKDRWRRGGGEVKRGDQLGQLGGGGSTVLYLGYRSLTGRVQGTPGPVTTRHNTLDHKLCYLTYLSDALSSSIVDLMLATRLGHSPV